MKTQEACRLLREHYWVLIGLVRFGKIKKPAKDASGDYMWSMEDIEHARRVLAERRDRVSVA